MILRVCIYEDTEALRESLVRLISQEPGFVVAGAFQNALHADEQTDELLPDVILMDIGMPGISGIEGLRRIRKRQPEVNILMFTVFEDDANLFEAIKAGASGYLLKKTTPDKILHAIREAGTGGAPMSPGIARRVLDYLRLEPRKGHQDYQLTTRETQVLDMLVKGYSYKMISAGMNISLDTVRSHIKNIYGKLQVKSKSEAVAKALKEDLL